MRTTVNLDEELLAKASTLSGTVERTALLREGLQALIERESAHRLALLGGSDKKATATRRQRDVA